MNFIKLYRTITAEELYVLVTTKKIVGRHNFEHKNSTYKKELGPVVCCGTAPRDYQGVFPFQLHFVLELNVPEDRVVGYGEGTYEMEDSYDGSYEELVLKEAYISYYTYEEAVIYTNENLEFLSNCISKGHHIDSLRFTPEQRRTREKLCFELSQMNDLLAKIQHRRFPHLMNGEGKDVVSFVHETPSYDYSEEDEYSFD